jgi:chemotaxis protein methyltransferase CheR
MKPQSFSTLATLLRVGSGLVIGPDKTYLLEARLAAILKEQRLPDLDALASACIPRGPGCWSAGSSRR